MRDVTRLITTVDDNNSAPAHSPESRQVSVSALHEAELNDGTRIVLLDDRGWSSTGDWSSATVQDIDETARSVVGPDEPYGGATREEAARGHWGYLSEFLARAGVTVDASLLRRLPHDVVLTQRLSERLEKG